MNEKTHVILTRWAKDFVNSACGRWYEGPAAEAMVKFSEDIDHVQDLEIVDVEFGRDDPHKREFAALDDIPRYGFLKKDYTAFNHFIDIQKGDGLFDDYDGYSYQRGSAGRGQYESIHASLPAYLKPFYGRMKVDEFIHFGLNDEYVHAYGHKWYRDCSPSLQHYSYPGDLKRHASVKAELAARFPLADCLGKKGKGVPYSVFMPVDNMGRYWYGRYLQGPRKRQHLLGAVLHAVQDACVPHHAAGYNGNWHARYELDLDCYAAPAILRPRFRKEVEEKVWLWLHSKSPAPPASLALRDRHLTPSPQWKVEQDITWCALHAYHEYVRTHHRYQKGYRRSGRSMHRLLVLAAAMSILILIKAHSEHRGKRKTRTCKAPKNR
ncbi:hypothetical protein JW933_02460 [candidate division FCPU426 bacterium]|nr:hypothetical protein [candidate division FCPU426 bacterium]